MVIVGTEPANLLFNSFVHRVRHAHTCDKIAEGVFGEMMDVALVCAVLFPAICLTNVMQVNDGPVTMCIDSKDRKGKGK